MSYEQVFDICIICDTLQDLLRLYYKAGVTGTPVMFLLTDNQIVNDEFLVYISDLLATGDACDLCTAEDKAALCNAVRSLRVPISSLLTLVDFEWTYATGTDGC